ncbi:MAG: glycosyltransferase family 4 protein [Candidatus Thorarchaeota archaeon]
MSKLTSKILMMIDIKVKHEYFLNLLDELLKEKTNIFIYKNNKFIFPIFLNALLLKGNKIIHFHFIDKLAGFHTKYKLKLILNSIKFLIDVSLAKYISRSRIIWTINNLHSHELFFPRFEKFTRSFFAKIANKAIAHCYIAKKIIQEEFKIHPNKIYMIPHGNYLKGYKNEISQEKAREILSLSNDQLVFLHIGNIRPYKGIDDILDTFLTLKNDGSMKLLIIGMPINKKVEKNLIKKAKRNNNIIFRFGRIPNDKVQIYMNASDIIVTSYKQILTSGTVILAMSFGKPVIAPRMGCIPEILTEDNAFLYNPQENDGLLKVFNKVLKKKEKLSEIGQKNLNLIKKFDWNMIAKKTKKLYGLTSK